MAKKKKEPEPVEADIPEPKKTVLSRATGVVKRNPNATWRTFQLAFYGFMVWAFNSAPGYIDKYFEYQKAQAERQAKWAVRGEERFQILSSKLDSTNFKIDKLTSKTKIK